MTRAPEPLLDPPLEPARFADLTIDRLEVPENITAMRRLVRLLDRVTHTEMTQALANAHRTHTDGKITVELACDANARLLHGRLTATGSGGQVRTHELTRLRVRPPGIIWVSAAHPSLDGALLDAADRALHGWLLDAIGHELEAHVRACTEYAEVVAALAHHLDPNIPASLKCRGHADLAPEARRSGARFAALLLAPTRSTRRTVAVSLAESWSGGIADLLAAVDAVLAPAVDE